MPRTKILMPDPTKEQVEMVRGALARAGFGGLAFGNLRCHTPGQHIPEDVVIIGGEASRLGSDATGVVVAVPSLEDLRRVEPDANGRPILVDIPEFPAEMPGRRELFAQARAAGAKVSVAMTNYELYSAVRQAEESAPRMKPPDADRDHR